jgi:Spy/CpxP family protein refolding chaperone
MQKELDLTSDQRQKIDQILKSSHERSKQVWDSVAPKFQEEYRAMREAIRAQLTPEQQAKYEAVFKPHGKSNEGKGRENKTAGDAKSDKE